VVQWNKALLYINPVCSNSQLLCRYFYFWLVSLVINRMLTLWLKNHEVFIFKLQAFQNDSRASCQTSLFSLTSCPWIIKIKYTKFTCSDLFSLWTKNYGANHSIETFPAVLLYRNIASRYFIIKKKDSGKNRQSTLGSCKYWISCKKKKDKKISLDIVQ